MWSWAFLVRRPAYSIFSAVYQYVEKIRKSSRKLWLSVVSGLQLAIDIAPFLYVSLRTRPVDLVTATDASMDGRGVVHSVVPVRSVDPIASSTVTAEVLATAASVMHPDSGVSSQAFSIIGAISSSINPNCVLEPTAETRREGSVFSLSKAGSIELLPCTRLTALTPAFPYSDRPFSLVNPVDADLTNIQSLYQAIWSLGWSTADCKRWSQRQRLEHINSLELRAVLAGIFSALQRRPSAVGSRFLLFTDSAVALFGLVKGRSSSHPLLRRLRSIAALCLACDLRPLYRFISSELNPADLPSRYGSR